MFVGKKHFQESIPAYTSLARRLSFRYCLGPYHSHNPVPVITNNPNPSTCIAPNLNKSLTMEPSCTFSIQSECRLAMESTCPLEPSNCTSQYPFANNTFTMPLSGRTSMRSMVLPCWAGCAWCSANCACSANSSKGNQSVNSCATPFWVGGCKSGTSFFKASKMPVIALRITNTARATPTYLCQTLNCRKDCVMRRIFTKS